MAIGGNNQNNKTNSTVSSFTVKNNKQVLFNTGELNFTSLKTEYWNGLLVIKIEPCINTPEGFRVDTDNNISIYLTPTKVRMFSNAIKMFLEDPDKYKNIGVNSSNALVTFSNGADYNVKGPLIAIRKLTENGEILSSNTYEFKIENTVIVNFDDNNPSNERVSLSSNFEIDLLLEIFDDFARYSNKVCAYWNEYTFEYQINTRNELLNNIAEKLGVERKKKQQGSFFNDGKQSNVTAPTKNTAPNSLEDMM